MESSDNLNVILSHLKNVSRGKENPNKSIIDLTIKLFEKHSRPEIGTEIAKYASRIIQKFGKQIISNQQLFGSLYDVATYLKWKCLTDLNTTALDIYYSTIIPTSKIMDQYFKSSVKIKEPKNLAFVPANPLFPRNYQNANQTGAIGLIESFIESDNKESKLTIFIYKENAPQIELTKYHNKVDFVVCDTFLHLNNELKSRNCDALIQDYFMWGQVVLSYNFQHIPTIYLDPGFLPFFISPVKKIISLPSQKNFANQFQKNSKIVTYLDRPYANHQNLIDCSQRKKFNQNSIIFGSLGRGEKLQKEYIEYIAMVLREIKNSKFHWAGARSQEKINEFPEDVRDRILIHDPIRAGEFLKDIDIFLETFPENQGYAVLDALHMKCAVITYDPKNTNANKSERIKDLIFKNFSDVIYFIKEIIHNENKRNELLNMQEVLIKSFPQKKDYWQRFIASMKQ